MAARADAIASAGETSLMRLDRFLWHARLVKTRGLAQALATTGHLRIDGRAVARASACVRVGNVLTYARADGRVCVVRVLDLPQRRGPAPEAARCYADLSRPPPPPPAAAGWVD